MFVVLVNIREKFDAEELEVSEPCNKEVTIGEQVPKKCFILAFKARGKNTWCKNFQCEEKEITMKN